LEERVAGDTAHSIVVKKQGDYRGQTKIWSNRYHFTNDLPADPAHWDTFMNAVVAAEKLIYAASETIIQVVGYDASTASSSNPHGDAVYSKDYTTAGTFVPAGTDVGVPGDCASLVRYTTAVRSSKNHPVYLFNYYHGCWGDGTSADTQSPTQVTREETYATAWITGFSDGSETHSRCGPSGHVALTRRVDPFIRHRDFPS
jgi:hypothetical protein